MTDGERRHTHRYTRQHHGGAIDARLHSPVFARNGPPLIEALAPYLADRTGPVLEIGAGTGQHAAAFARAFPGLDWVASDPFADHRASIRAWMEDLPAPVPEALDIDASGPWAARGDVRALGPLAAIFAANVTHIAPRAVTLGILAGASETLDVQRRLFIYGPFRDGDEFFGDGNLRFDRSLRQENPAWGLRDLGQVETAAAERGLHLETVHRMPANNQLLVFSRAADQ